MASGKALVQAGVGSTFFPSWAAYPNRSQVSEVGWRESSCPPLSTLAAELLGSLFVRGHGSPPLKGAVRSLRCTS